ncbi:hypothetical protein JHL17_21510 [Azospirillum sp. YIM B02556]|uniref:Dihydroneopterin aldolase/epimerase domain-containing protein n=1 Tax=Azospirillum endophyticum TaxID=2800326 RepID=A0ABS1F9E5_9PROT|nr:hypothetical protein [Azospirillum endophyticum]MBK1839988.1 hypothetical protein [Azospirillum endophyticum]
MSDDSAKRAVLVQPGGAPLTYTILVRGFAASVALAGRADRAQVRFDLTLTVTHPGPGFPDDIEAVMSYEDIVEDLRRLCRESNVPGADYLADRAADLCLSHGRVRRVQVDVTVPAADSSDSAAGTSLTRARPDRA